MKAEEMTNTEKNYNYESTSIFKCKSIPPNCHETLQPWAAVTKG